MLQDIENYYCNKTGNNIWENENIKWFDPAAGMGNYPICIYYKLLEGLSYKFPDLNDRKRHIIENQLYMGELNNKNCFIIKQIFNINNEYKLNLYEGDALEIDIKKEFGINRFDIIIGNPPYNEEFNNNSAAPLYNKFIDYFVDKCNILSFIIPSRWFAGGKGLDKFRKRMLNRKDINFIKHINNASSIFGNFVDIKGGVNYFLIDKDYTGLCSYNNTLIDLTKYDILVESKYYDIIDKLIGYKSITDIYIGRYFGVESNDKRLIDKDTIDKAKLNDYITCYVSQQKGNKKYIDKKTILRDTNFYKVITPIAAHSGKSGFGNIFIGLIDEIHTGSYNSFKTKTLDEAKSLLSYLNCKLPHFMLMLRKISLNISGDTCKWIPLPPLDRIWNNDDIYQYFKLNADEIKLIKETQIKGYI
jgi:site-specific DNA-methyltransferase (adenine-specific)